MIYSNSTGDTLLVLLSLCLIWTTRKYLFSVELFALLKYFMFGTVVGTCLI